MSNLGRLDRFGRTPDYLAIARRYLAVNAVPAEPEYAAASPARARSRPERVREAGDVAEAIHAHLAVCHICRLEHFTTDAVAPCCPAGAGLKVLYRDARAAAFDDQPEPASEMRS